jgi:hypothetical protein
VADEIIEKGPHWTIYRDGTLGPAIPYPSVDHGNGEQNFGFADLRHHPEAIPQVPEADGCPGLQEFLRVVNASASPLMSLGCAHGPFPIDAPHPDGPQCYEGSYIDLAYRDAVIGHDEAALIKLAKSIVTALSEPTSISLELIPQRMRHFFGDLDCYCLDVKLSAYGRSPKEALYHFNRVYGFFAGIMKAKVLPTL